MENIENFLRIIIIAACIIGGIKLLGTKGERCLGLFLILGGIGSIFYLAEDKPKQDLSPSSNIPSIINSNTSDYSANNDNIQTYIKVFVCPVCGGSGMIYDGCQQYYCSSCIDGNIYFEDIDCPYCSDGITGYGDNIQFCDNCLEGSFNYYEYYKNGKRAVKIGKYAYKVYKNRELAVESVNLAKRAARNGEWKKASEEIISFIKRVK